MSTGRHEPSERLFTRPEIGPGLLWAVWITYIVGYYLGLRRGINLAPAVLIPVMATSWRRSIRLATVVGLVTLPLLWSVGEFASYETELPVSILGAVASAALGVATSFVSSVFERLVVETQNTRAARERADEAQRVYRTLYEGVPVGLWRTRPDGKIVEANPAFGNFFGYSVEEILELDAGDLYMDPADRMVRIESLVSGGVLHGAILRMKHRAGSPVLVRVNAQVVLDADGEVLHFDGVGVDVTSEVQNEKLRQASDALLRSAFDAAPIGMAISGADDWVIVHANPSLEQMLGYGSGELDGLHIADISTPEDMERNRQLRTSALERGDTTVTMQKSYVCKNGETLQAQLSTSLVPDSNPPMVVAFVADISDQVRARDALEELVRAKDQFLATVSHELRTPLTVVHGMAHELRDGWARFSGAEQQEMAGMIAGGSTELSHLVEDLLVVARADMGTLEVLVEAVDMRAEVDAALASVPASIARIVDVECAEVHAVADRLRVRQILRNLLTNADRYGGELIHLRVAPVPLSNVCTIQVRDNGGGVPDDLAAAVFEPYERAHSLGVTTEAVGLGLTVSRTLAESMGGSLEYRREDGWSVFDLRLPVKEGIVAG